MGLFTKFVAATGVIATLSSNPVMAEEDLERAPKDFDKLSSDLRIEIGQLVSGLSDQVALNMEDRKAQNFSRGLGNESNMCFNQETGMLEGERGLGQYKEKNVSGDYERRQRAVQSFFKGTMNLQPSDDVMEAHNSKVQALYDQIQEMFSQGKVDEAQEMSAKIQQMHEDLQEVNYNLLSDLRDSIKWLSEQDHIQITGHMRGQPVPEGVADHVVIIYPPDKETGTQDVYITNLGRSGGNYEFVIDLVDTLKNNPYVTVALDVGDGNTGMKYQEDSVVNKGVDVPSSRIIPVCGV